MGVTVYSQPHVRASANSPAPVAAERTARVQGLPLAQAPARPLRPRRRQPARGAPPPAPQARRAAAARSQAAEAALAPRAQVGGARDRRLDPGGDSRLLHQRSD